MSFARRWSLVVSAALACAIPMVAAGQDGETEWEVVQIDAARIAVPRGWRSLDVIKPPVFRVGDGMGMLPPTDETGSPLQSGMSVALEPGTKESLQQVVADLVEGAKHQRDLRLVSHTVESLKLADGTEAALLKTLFVKDGSRRSLQMKLVAKGADSTLWIVSGHVVGGGESEWPLPESGLPKWLAAHLTSLALDGTKFDAAPLRAAYNP